MSTEVIPKAFVWRRMHSLMGIWLSIFLIEHLLVNSQAALFIGDDGYGFIQAVRSIKNFPYLPIIEMLFLGIPIFIHTVWGVKYALTARFNSFGCNGREPCLPEYSRNRAYTWQRITSWFLVVGIIAHVVHMRFIEQPISTKKGDITYYMVPVSLDKGLYTLAPRLGVELYDQNRIQLQQEKTSKKYSEGFSKESLYHFFISFGEILKKQPHLDEKTENKLIQSQNQLQEEEWVSALKRRPIGPGQAIAVAKDFGTADLLMLRETFKMPVMLVLYTLFVLTACFHAFNGLWTFMIKWGITLTNQSQKLMLKISTTIMFVMGLLGLSAVWMTYWVNLKQ